MRRPCIVFVVAAVLLSWVGTAQATSYATLTAKWVSVDPGCEVHYVNSPCNDGSFYVGMYWLKGLSQTPSPPVSPVPSLLGDIPIYCIDTYQWANTGTGTYTVADLADGPAGNGAPAMGATKAAYLKDLIYHHYSVNADDANKAAFAAAVWEIVYENVAWNVADGNMTVALTPAETTTANAWLAALSTHDHGNTAFALISTGPYQDYAIALGGGGEPIPEPLTLLAIGSGVAGIGAYIRKRRLALA